MKWLSACANINSSSWVYHGKLLSSQCAKHRHIIQLYIYLFQKDCKMPLLRILHLQRVQHFKAKLALRLKVKKLLHTIKDICNLGKAGRQWLKTVLKQIMTVASCQIIFSEWFSDPSELDLVLVIVSLVVGSSLVTVTLLLVWLAYRRRAIWLLHSAAPPRACCGCLRPGGDLILPWPRRNHCQLHWSRPHQNSCRQLH